MKKILVTGGAGYIGSHVAAELARAEYVPIIVDNFSMSDETAIKNLEKLIDKPVTFYETSFEDKAKLKEIISKEAIDGIIHIAAFKAVGESVSDPLKYYQNNVAGFVNLLEAITEAN